MARELNETQIKDKLVAFVQYLLNTPEKATFFCVDGQIRLPNEILKAKGLPEKKLHFKLDFLLDFLKGIVDFPNEYIKIKSNVLFDTVVEKEEGVLDNRFVGGQRQKKVVVAKSEIHGQGLIILENVKKDRFVIEYIGEVISAEERDRREQHLGPDQNVYFFKGDKLIVDAYYFGNEARFVNHACKPNCAPHSYWKGGHEHICYFSLMDIKANTELTVDYQFDTKLGVQCNCITGCPNEI